MSTSSPQPKNETPLTGKKNSTESGLDRLQDQFATPLGRAKVEEEEQSLKITFFDQVREIQKIVDEANRMED